MKNPYGQFVLFIWLWIRQKKIIIFGIVGGIIHFTYGIVPTLQPSNFGRVYAAYGGFFIISSILWGFFIDKKKTDRYEINWRVGGSPGSVYNFLYTAIGGNKLQTLNLFNMRFSSSRYHKKLLNVLGKNLFY